MSAKDYTSSPVNTSGINLPETLEELTESLAKNVHEVWASGRIKTGWNYGPVRDEAKKEYPCLIPYEELTEEEKDYDRAIAISTIKFIIANHYSIIQT